MYNNVKIIEFNNDKEFQAWQKTNDFVEIMEINYIRNSNPAILSDVTFYSQLKTILVEEETNRFNLSPEITYKVGNNSLSVFLNGLLLTPGKDYFEINSTEIQITENLMEGDLLTVVLNSIKYEESGAEDNYTLLVMYREPYNKVGMLHSQQGNLNDYPNIQSILFKNDDEFQEWQNSKRKHSNIEIIDVDYKYGGTLNIRGLVNLGSEVDVFKVTKPQQEFTLSDKLLDLLLKDGSELKLFLNGMYLTPNEDYELSLNEGKILIKEDLLEDDMLSALVNIREFSNVDSSVVNNYAIIVTYRESQNLSVARVENVKAELMDDGVYITWKDIFGENYEETIGFDWKLREEFKDSLSYMVFTDWKGVKIVRKEGSRPLNLEDGEIIAEISEPNKYFEEPFIDSLDNLILGKTYYYGVFPFDIWGMYNFDESNVDYVVYQAREISYEEPESPFNNSSIEIETLDNIGDVSISLEKLNLENWDKTEIYICELNGVCRILETSDKNVEINDLEPGKTYSFRLGFYDKDNNLIYRSDELYKTIPTTNNVKDIEINFIEESNYKPYFLDLKNLHINNYKLLIQSNDTEVFHDKYFMTKNINNDLNLKPIKFGHDASISIYCRVLTNPYSYLGILSKDNGENSLFKKSGYFSEYTLDRIDIKEGEYKLCLRLSSNDKNSKVFIDKIILKNVIEE